jgi:hypothetical protein
MIDDDDGGESLGYSKHHPMHYRPRLYHLYHYYHNLIFCLVQTLIYVQSKEQVSILESLSLKASR